MPADDKVVSLWGGDVRSLPEGASPAVIECLEEWLARAKRGELVALGLIGVRPDQHIATAYAGVSMHAVNASLVIGGAQLLSRRVVDDVFTDAVLP